MNGGLNDDEQGGFRAGGGVNQIFTLKQERKNADYMWVLQIWRCTIGLIGKLCGKC